MKAEAVCAPGARALGPDENPGFSASGWELQDAGGEGGGLNMFMLSDRIGRSQNLQGGGGTFGSGQPSHMGLVPSKRGLKEPPPPALPSAMEGRRRQLAGDLSTM